MSCAFWEINYRVATIDISFMCSQVLSAILTFSVYENNPDILQIAMRGQDATSFLPTGKALRWLTISIGSKTMISND
jgi:hypothetical protein